MMLVDAAREEGHQSDRASSQRALKQSWWIVHWPWKQWGSISCPWQQVWIFIPTILAITKRTYLYAAAFTNTYFVLRMIGCSTLSIIIRPAGWKCLLMRKSWLKTDSSRPNWFKIKIDSFLTSSDNRPKSLFTAADQALCRHWKAIMSRNSTLVLVVEQVILVESFFSIQELHQILFSSDHSDSYPKKIQQNTSEISSQAKS